MDSMELIASILAIFGVRQLIFCGKSITRQDFSAAGDYHYSNHYDMESVLWVFEDKWKSSYIDKLHGQMYFN